MCQFVGRSGKLSGRAAGVHAGVPLPGSFPVQLAASVPHAALIAVSFLSPCLWPGAPLLALLLSGDGWRLRVVLVGIPAASPAPGPTKGRLWQGKAASAGVVNGCKWLCWATAVTGFWSTTASLAVSCALLPACVRHKEAGKAVYSPVYECRDFLRQHRVEEQYCSLVKQAYKEHAFTSALLAP